MKKIISFLLAAVLLVSAVPMAHAAETTDYTNGTAVVYTATNTEAYTVTVPALLAPGGSGTVTLSGTWPSDKKISVTADTSVTLTNSISGADAKTLTVTFAGMAYTGDNTQARTYTETISVADISNALFGTWSGRFYYNVAVYDVVDYLQVKYPFDYYSTMNLAVTDVNNGTIGASADVDKEDAVAGIYTDENGGVNVVLLQDTTEATRLKPSVDMTINLGGHTLSTEDKVAIDTIAGNITIDGRLDGSTISVNHTDGNVARALQLQNSSNVTIIGGTYISNSKGANSACIAAYHSANLTIEDASVQAIDTTGTTGAIYAIQVSQGTTATITNCAIKAYSNYTYDDETYYGAISRGIGNFGTLTLNNCSVIGTHSGISNNGTLYVNGGTYEGYGHGGIYFAGSDTTSYVRNAIIRQCAMPDGYTATTNCNGAGFYIGGNAEANNITVYMDNCDIYGSVQPIVLRGSSGEQNNSLYISNSRINKDYTKTGVRIDNNTHKLYIGTGCNFTAEDTTLPEAVVVTDETYIYTTDK